MEVRMGSPLFGSIEVRGLKRRFDGRQFSEAMAFSLDSRFFAIAELVDCGRDGPTSRVVVLDLPANREFVATPSAPGLIRTVTWNRDGALSIVHWQHPYGETTLTWSPPKNA
jgi:hypothetical protein